jgi:hypothetical protein
MYWVYVLWSECLGKRYVGATKNVEARLEEDERDFVELEFPPTGIEALLPREDDSRFFPREQLNDLIQKLENAV